MAQIHPLRLRFRTSWKNSELPVFFFWFNGKITPNRLKLSAERKGWAVRLKTIPWRMVSWIRRLQNRSGRKFRNVPIKSWKYQAGSLSFSGRRLLHWIRRCLTVSLWSLSAAADVKTGFLQFPRRNGQEERLPTQKNGEIILLHDMLHNINTVKALKTIVPELKNRGFTFHMVADLFRTCGVSPVRNRLYTNVFQTMDRPDLAQG